MGKSPKVQQKRVHVHYPRECDIFASKPPARRMRQSFTISASHAPRELSDEIRPDARPAEWADGEADRAAFRLIEIRQALVEIDIPTSLVEPSADDIIEGYKQLIARAHAHGMKIIAATLTPFDGAFDGTPFQGYYTPEKEKIRLALNAFLRSGAFDSVIDFDKLIADPQKPSHSQAKYDKGDHMHPNPAGYAAMGSVIDLKTLTSQ
jgi:hypothetical protein